MAKNSRKKKAAPKDIQLEYSQVFEEATGTDNYVLQLQLIRQVRDTLWVFEEEDEKQARDKLMAAIETMAGIKPTDKLEGMLAVQMIGTHNAAIECLRRAMIPDQTLAGRDLSLKHASKLLSIYTRQIETLDKHRGKGQQKVTVEYVNVEPGGQAIVGNVKSSGRAKKSGQTDKEEPKIISHNPSETIDMKPAKSTTKSKRKS